MRLNVIFLLFALLLSFSNTSDAFENIGRINRSDERPKTEIKTVNIGFIKDGDQKRLKSILIRYFTELKEVNDKDIVSVKLIDRKNIYNFGDSKIYEIILSDKLPEVFPKRNYLIVGNKNQLGALVLLDSLIFIKKVRKDDSCLLAGISKVKAYGYFKIYDFKKPNAFIEKLNTMDNGENGLPVFNNALDCISYLPAQLHFKNIDVNNDGLLDIVFYGVVASYCKGLETGYGRVDRKPISKTKFTLSFRLKIDKNDNITYELLKKETIYKFLAQ